MKIVLLSGGPGKRLWPMTKGKRSKPFLPLITVPSGRKLSMLQQTMQHIAALGLADDTLIVAPEEHASLIAEHIGPGTDCLGEPEQRDTFPAIVLAATHLFSERRVSEDEFMVVIPVDGNANREFYARISLLEKHLSRRLQFKIGMIGVKPAFPSGKFGYIVPGHALDQPLMPVKRFVEKPDPDTARELIAEGALWNSGIFAFRIGYILEWLQTHGYPTDFTGLRQNFGTLPASSFDYEIAEPEARHAACLTYEGPWDDLGTWKSLAGVMKEQIHGNVVIDDRSRDTFVLNDSGLPLIVAGISGAVIVAGSEGILVSDRDRTHELKPLVEQLENNRRAFDSVKKTGIGPDCRELLAASEQPSEALRYVTHRIRLKQGDELEPLPTAIRTTWVLLDGAGTIRGPHRDEPAAPGKPVAICSATRFQTSTDSELLELATFRLTE